MRSKSSQIALYNATLGMRTQNVGSWRHIIAMVTVTVAGTASSKVLFRGSAQEALPNVASASTPTNFHQTVQAKNLSDGTTINGSVGIPTDALGTYLLEINTNYLEWLGLDVASAGGATYFVDIVGAGDVG